MTTQLIRFACGQCNRAATEIHHCPARLNGSCAFVRADTTGRSLPPDDGQGLATPVSIFKAIAMLALALYLIMWANLGGWTSVAILAAIVVALLIPLRQTYYYDATSHVHLTVRSFAGSRLSHQWTPAGRLLPIKLEPAGPFAYPLSVAALAASCERFPATRPQAAAVLRAALVGLLARGYLQVGQFTQYGFQAVAKHPAASTHFVLAAANPPAAGDAIGVLEEDILAVLMRSGNDFSGDAIGMKRHYNAYALVCDVYVSDRSDPNTWVASLVADDAVARGLVKRTKYWRSATFAWETTIPFRQHQQVTRELSRQLAADFPAFSVDLDDQIERAIVSRIESSGD